ncbi:hypothetical protein ACFL0B_07515 [Thermodesulfobacteriota bacterium]
MKIFFEERPIYKAPLEVLQHLYYYTTQYGLSVKQFTGEHQKYWERLPERLQAASQSEDDLKSIINELEQLAKDSEARLRKRREQKDRGWAEKEIVLNAQLLSVLAAFPRQILADGFKKLTQSNLLPPELKIVDVSLLKDDGSPVFVFVEPDLLLLGNHHLLMVELKTRGGAKSSRNYPPSQLLNYLRLAAECIESSSDNLPTAFSHLVLLPSSDLKWFDNYSEWVSVDSEIDGKLIIDADKCIQLGGHKSSYDHENVRDLFYKIPIYYRSWEQLEEAFKLAVETYGDKKNMDHWIEVCRELTDLAKVAGKYS